MTTDNFEERLQAVEARLMAVENDSTRRAADYEVFKLWVDSRVSQLANQLSVQELTEPATVTIKPAATPAGQCECVSLREELRETRECLSELTDMTLKCLAGGVMNVERAGDLKRRVLALAGRTVTG